MMKHFIIKKKKEDITVSFKKYMHPPPPYKKGGGIYILNETRACATTYLLKHGHVLNLSHFFYLCRRCNDQTLFMSVFLVEETGVTGESHRSVAIH
jgi:hypothetical protein